MSIVTLHVACSSTGVRSERRFDKGLTISAVKGKLEMIVGAPAGYQTLSLKDHTGETICTMEENDAMLGAYPVEDFLTLYVLDGNPHGSSSDQFENTALVEKQDMGEEEYDNLKHIQTVRQFKQKMKMGRFNPEIQAERAAAEVAKEVEFEEEAKAMKVGDRCEVAKGGKKRGEVKFVGKTDFAKGWWCGIKYDEPLGKNDGSVKGTRYFECSPGYGIFIRPNEVAVGDYPEIDELDFSSDDEM